MNFTKNNIQQKYLVVGVIIIVVISGLIGFGFSSFSAENEEPEIAALPWEDDDLEVNTDEDIETEEESPFYVVDVKGEVKNPGVYTVKDGERVHDVIEQAGGFTSGAFIEAINLAERCYDEMVIIVPIEGEEIEGSDIVSSVGESSSDDGILLNQASDSELTELPGIGPAKAEAIVAFREENGPFQKVDDLVEVPGIGEKTLESIKDFLIVR